MKKLALFLTLLLTSLFFLLPESHAKQPLDEIESYVIDARVREDATIDFTYTIRWRVLDSTTEGPLDWVKIGVPNHKVDDIKALSSNIRKAEYYHDDGDFIRCDFYNEYHKDEIVEFAFSFHALYMFEVISAEKIHIAFIAGWFDEINVKQLTINWYSKEALTTDSAKLGALAYETDHYTYTVSLPMGSRGALEFEYAVAQFPNIDLGMSSENMPRYIDWTLVAILVVIAIVVAIAIIVSISKRDPYFAGRGFTDYHPSHYAYFHIYHPVIHHYDRKGNEVTDPRVPTGGFHGGHSGGGGHCACACACACAGGGRAGCARKDFYHPNLEAKRVIAVLRKEE